MEVATKRTFEINGEELDLTVVGESSKYENRSDAFQPQLVKSYILRSKGAISIDEVLDVEENEIYSVTDIKTKLGFTYLTVTRKNNAY